MPKMKPGKDQGNAALPKLGSPWTSKHSQDLLKYNAVDDHAAHPMSMRGPLDKGHPMKKYGDPMKKYGPLSSHGPGGTHPDTNKKPITMDFNVGTGLVEKEGDRRKRFEKAFATARKAGVEEFTYNVGEEPKKKYTTKLKGE